MPAKLLARHFQSRTFRINLRVLFIMHVINNIVRAGAKFREFGA